MGSTTANEPPSSRASTSTSRSSLRHSDGGLLDQAVALALAAQHVERAEVVEVEHRDRDGVIVAAGAGQLARELVLEHAPGRDAGELVGERERLHARAQAGVLDRDRGLGGQQPQHARRRRPAPTSIGQLPDHDQHAGDLAVAQHRLEQRRARRRGVDERLGERGVRARVGDEVALARRERAARSSRPAAGSSPAPSRRRSSRSRRTRGRRARAGRRPARPPSRTPRGRRRGGRPRRRRARARRARPRPSRGRGRAASR